MSQKPRIDLTADEQMRIIEETGVMKKVQNTTENEPHMLVAFLLSIPLIFCLVTFDYLVHMQFGTESQFNFARIKERHIPAIPAIFILCYVSNIIKSHKIGQFILMVSSVVVGCFVIHLNIDDGTWGALNKTPGLVTIGVLLVIQADLTVALISVFMCAMYYYRQILFEFVPIGQSIGNLHTDL